MSDPTQDLTTRIAAMSSLPVSLQRLVLRGLEQVFATDPALTSVNTTVRAWDGNVMEQMVPAPQELPLLRLTPRVGPYRWAFEGQHLITVPIGVEIYTPGVDAATMLDFADAIFVALFPDDPTRGQAVKSAFGSAAPVLNRMEWVQGFGTPEIIGEARYGLKTLAQVNAYFYRDSRWWGDPGPS